MDIGKLIKRILSLFKSNSALWQGVPLINIYCLRLLYTLMFLVLGKDVWTYIFTHTGGWEPNKAMAFSVWASFSLLAFLGILQPLKLLPILLLEIVYKLIWLILVAYPLWLSGNLEGSSAEGMTAAFAWVLLPILFVPWKHAFKTYVLPEKRDYSI
ncbi:hypothetical protein ACFP1I_12820 [Dyadobacter subterraneus]|uniref:Uncharacterized protein n=1 Tax=Dyadobacter subterraneus TaxID=2773304 RepID=A0ABR9W9E2_9BACT|nr:hypothetical protein [Dyadobacter subterraneus]MBE9462113.1 hypothetical protein [Dyadobacter subterraneus]